jgi:hypothetical protein
VTEQIPSVPEATNAHEGPVADPSSRDRQYQSGPPLPAGEPRSQARRQRPGGAGLIVMFAVIVLAFVLAIVDTD